MTVLFTPAAAPAPAIPAGYIHMPFPADLKTPQDVQGWLTPIFQELSEDGKARFRTIAQKHANWSGDLTVALAFAREIHTTFPMFIPDPNPAPAPVQAFIPTQVSPAAALQQFVDGPAPVQQAAPVQAQPVAPTSPAPAPVPDPVPVPPAPAPVPAPAITPAPAQQAAPEPEQDTETDDEADESTDAESTDAEDNAEGTDAPGSTDAATPAPATAAPFAPAGNPNGLFSQLHASLAEDEIVCVYVSRQKDLLTVNIIPSGTKGEPSAISQVQVQATPDALDAELPAALHEYAQARHQQRAQHASVSAQVKKSVDASKAKAATKAGAKTDTKGKDAAARQGTLTLNANVKAQAVIKGHGKTEKHEIGPEHTTVQLRPGLYSVSVTADGYFEHKENVTVDAGKTVNVQATLNSAGLGF